MIFDGVCPYCGQIQKIRANSQEEANRIAAQNCKCDAASAARRKEQLHNAIEGIAGQQAEDYGFRPVAIKALEELHTLSEMVMSGVIQSVSINIDETKISMKLSSKGAVKVNRTETKGLAQEC